MRAAGADDFTKLATPLELNLDNAVEYIADDELIEVTPSQIRMLKNPDKVIYKAFPQTVFT
jgi:GTP-binding protein